MRIDIFTIEIVQWFVVKLGATIEGNKHVSTRVEIRDTLATPMVIGVDYIIAAFLYTRVDLNLDWSDLSILLFEQFLPVRNKSFFFSC